MLPSNVLEDLNSETAHHVLYGLVGTGTFLAAVVIFRVFDYFMGRGGNKDDQATEGEPKIQQPSLLMELIEDMKYALIVSAVSLLFTWFIASTLIPDDDVADLDVLMDNPTGAADADFNDLDMPEDVAAAV